MDNLTLSNWRAKLRVMLCAVQSNTPVLTVSRGLAVSDIGCRDGECQWCSDSEPPRPAGGNWLQQSPPGAVHGAEENKSIKAAALRRALLLVWGGAELRRRGEAPRVLDSIRQPLRPPLGAGCTEGGGTADLSNKDVRPTVRPY